MKINKIIFFIVFLAFHINHLYSQDFDTVMIEHKNLKLSLQSEKSILDSLKNILEKKAFEIDHEKEKNQPDNDRIIQLMASTVTISNKIEINQRKVEQIENKIQVLERILRRSLDKKYSIIIDSLTTAGATTDDPEKKQEIKRKILYYTEKKLEVAPKIPLLSLQPDKILAIDLLSVTDPLEKEIYYDYLINALAEVDNQLIAVKSSYSELEEILYIQDKANKFLEEIEFDRIPQTIIHQSQNKNESTFGDGIRDSYDWSRNQLALIPQIEAYINIFQQLNLSQLSEVENKWSSPIDSLQNNLSLNDYKNLLLDVEKRLKEYRLILSHKVGLTE